MRQLMISLDKKVFDETSAVAQRMIDYEYENELSIIVPCSERVIKKFGTSIIAIGSGGGSKVLQFFNLYRIGKECFKKNKIDTITCQDPFFTGLIGVLLKKRFNVALEIQLHGDFFNQLSDGTYEYPWWRRKFGLWTLKRADRLRVVSQRVQENLLNLGFSHDLIIVRPAVSKRDILWREMVHQPRDLRAAYPGYEKFFIVIGRLDPVKNIAWLLGVFKAYVEEGGSAALIIVGEGEEKERLTALAKKLGLLEKKVFFLPWTTDPYSYYLAASAVLFPSRSESYGRVVMEASAVGTPVIMSDVGVAGFELKPGPKVTILPVNDGEGFKNAMLRI